MNKRKREFPTDFTPEDLVPDPIKETERPDPAELFRYCIQEFTTTTERDGTTCYEFDLQKMRNDQAEIPDAIHELWCDKETVEHMAAVLLSAGRGFPFTDIVKQLIDAHTERQAAIDRMLPAEYPDAGMTPIRRY